MLRKLLVRAACLGMLASCAGAGVSGPAPDTSVVARLEGPLASLAPPAGAVEWVRLANPVAALGAEDVYGVRNARVLRACAAGAC